ASYMAKKGDVYAVASSDLDSILFGAPRLIRNLNITGKRKIPGTGAYRDVVPEVLSCNKILKELGITHEQLINLGILIGTDYNPGGIKGIGPKTALKLVRKHPAFDDLFANVKWDCEIQPETIRDFFISPPVTDDYAIVQGAPDIEKVKKILCTRHEFLEERVDNTFRKLLELNERKKQTTLGKWG
ncbi:MAG: flap structure-specific endonuclease, partial [Candidatus Aenigmarchaeota archaeon]|nr:flap structure-specific endonuclease [Candidatus Aenigmarchaeota archaeon]